MTEIYVKVMPDSNEFSLELGNMPVFFLENEAENRRANTELIERIESLTGERPAIVSGQSSSRKKLKTPLEKEEFMERLENHG